MHIFEFNPHDHYWKKASGALFSSRRRQEIAADDPEYQAWLAAGHLPTAYPQDTEGNESEEELNHVLAPYDLGTAPLTLADKRKLLYLTRADPHRDEAISYKLEAEAWRRRNENAKADQAEAKAFAAMEKYLAVKEAIRYSHADSEARDGDLTKSET